MGHHAWEFSGFDAEDEEEDFALLDEMNEGLQEEDNEEEEEDADDDEDTIRLKKRKFGCSKHFDIVHLKVVVWIFI